MVVSPDPAAVTQGDLNTFKELLKMLASTGQLNQIFAEIEAEGGGSMSDASKRRQDASGPAATRSRGSANAEPAAEPAATAATPTAGGEELPTGIESIEVWGRTLIKVGKLKDSNLCYDELYQSTTEEHKGYVKWLVDHSVSKSIGRPMMDLIDYLMAKTARRRERRQVTSTLPALRSHGGSGSNRARDRASNRASNRARAFGAFGAFRDE